MGRNKKNKNKNMKKMLYGLNKEAHTIHFCVLSI